MTNDNHRVKLADSRAQSTVTVIFSPPTNLTIAYNRDQFFSNNDNNGGEDNNGTTTSTTKKKIA